MSSLKQSSSIDKEMEWGLQFRFPSLFSVQ
jgi:hypothetical protein